MLVMMLFDVLIPYITLMQTTLLLELSGGSLGKIMLRYFYMRQKWMRFGLSAPNNVKMIIIYA